MITSPNGWLSPDGVFHECAHARHADCAGKIARSHLPENEPIFDSEKILEEWGYIKILDGGACVAYATGVVHKRPTQAQIDAVFDYHQKCRKELPYWIGEQE
ncbi:MAG: hypothetical protein WC444_04540 [Candidatus Paceibacterota bacterium]